MKIYPLSNHSVRWLSFRNDNSGQCPPGGILRLTGTVDVNDSPVLTADQPNTYGSQYLHAVNGPAAVDAGSYGLCVVPNDVFWVLAAYDTADGTPAFGEKWGPRDATWKLKKNTGGFQIVGDPDSTAGTVIVARSPMLSFIGKTDASHAKSATGTISIYAGSTLGSESDTSVNMTGVYNRFAAVATTKWVRCEWNNEAQQWELTAAEC